MIIIWRTDYQAHIDSEGLTVMSGRNKIFYNTDSSLIRHFQEHFSNPELDGKRVVIKYIETLRSRTNGNI